MRFLLELDDKENLLENKKICDILLSVKNGYTQPIDSSKIKFNLNGCLINALYIKEGKTIVEFIPEMID